MSIDILKLVNRDGWLLREYCQLASCKQLSQQKADRLAEILVLAESNQELSFLLNEADHFMAHELGLLDGTSRNRYKDQQSKLREYLGFGPQSNPVQTVSLASDCVQSCSESSKYEDWQLRHCL